MCVYRYAHVNLSPSRLTPQNRESPFLEGTFQPLVEGFCFQMCTLLIADLLGDPFSHSIRAHHQFIRL